MAVLKPLDDAEMDERQRRMMDAMLARGRDYNVFRTMLHHPAAMEAFLGWGSYILSDQNTLSVALRELVILRTGALRRCEYEFLRHAVIARKHGFTDEVLRAIATLMNVDIAERGRGHAAARRIEMMRRNLNVVHPDEVILPKPQPQPR